MTTTLPVIRGCRLQKYSKVPGWVKVKENVSPVSSPGDRKVLAIDVTVWASSSRLVQVTVVPAFTVSAGALNPWARISTRAVSICAGASSGRPAAGPP